MVVFFFSFVSAAVEVFSEASKLNDFLTSKSLSAFVTTGCLQLEVFHVAILSQAASMLTLLTCKQTLIYYILFITGICNFKVIDTSSSRYCKIVLSLVTMNENDKRTFF